MRARLVGQRTKNQADFLFEYWYATADESNQNMYAHFISTHGSGHTAVTSTQKALRPVIEISKDIIKLQEVVTYDSTYGKLPEVTQTGKIFNGWATSGGDVITSTTKVQLAENHTVYAQWGNNTFLATLT